MTLLGDIASAGMAPGGKCTVAVLLAHLGPQDAADLREALAGPYMGTAIARALTKRGHRIAGQTVSRHRRGECGCQT